MPRVAGIGIWPMIARAQVCDRLVSLRNLEDLLHERGVGVSHETVRFR